MSRQQNALLGTEPSIPMRHECGGIYTVPIPPSVPYERHIPDDGDIPPELLKKDRWLVWRVKPRANGGVDKLPISPKTGYTCNPTNLSLLTAFAHAHDFALSHSEVTGLGFSMFPEDGIIGGDIDACIDQDGALSPLAKELLSTLDTYMEVSPSGKGLRFLGLGSLNGPIISHNIGLEIYTGKRYLTITGNAIPEKAFSLENIQVEVDVLACHRKLNCSTNNGHVHRAPVDEEEVLSALDKFDPSCGYTTWIEFGMALKSTGHPDAFDWWNKWSTRSSDKYPGREECWKKWQSFRQDGGITIKTLYWKERNLPSNLTPKSICSTDQVEVLDGQLQTFSKGHRLCTDVGNVNRLIDITQGNLRYVPALNKWIVWRGVRWEAYDTPYEIVRHVACSIYLEAQLETDTTKQKKITGWGLESQQRPRLNAMIELAKQAQEILLPDRELDASPHLLGVENGAVDLITGELLLPDRSRFITKSTGIPYHREAECPRWKKFVSEIMAGDEELISFLKRLAGYALWGGNPEQVVMILHGLGSNGKSSFVGALQSALGDYARQVAPTSLMANRYGSAGGPRADLVRLYRVRLAIAVESGEGDTLDEGLLKAVSGSDRINARALYAKDELEFTPEFLLLLATNNKPVIRGTDYAIWRRLILIPFERTFQEGERDRHLVEQLASEQTGILGWMIEGCLDWRANGLDTPQKVKIATQEYRSEMDILGDWIGERCVVDPTTSAPVGRLYQNYNDWSVKSGMKPSNPSWFGRNLQTKGFNPAKRNGVKYRDGLRLREDHHPGSPGSAFDRFRNTSPKTKTINI